MRGEWACCCNRKILSPGLRHTIHCACNTTNYPGSGREIQSPSRSSGVARVPLSVLKPKPDFPKEIVWKRRAVSEPGAYHLAPGLFSWWFMRRAILARFARYWALGSTVARIKGTVYAKGGRSGHGCDGKAGRVRVELLACSRENVCVPKKLIRGLPRL